MTVNNGAYNVRPTSLVFWILKEVILQHCAKPQDLRNKMTDPELEKLKAFDKKLEKAKKPKEVKEKSHHNKAMNDAYKYAIELFAGFVIGGFMGWSIDKWLETKPLFLIIFIFIGAAAGILNVIKSSKRDYEAMLKAQEDAASDSKKN